MKKVTILALHLGYGGVENAVSTLANLLCEKYEVEILSVYRLYKDPAFKINEKVKVTYLTNLRPNKKEMFYYLKRKNFKLFFKGIKKSAEVGYAKYIKTSLILRKLDSDVVISTKIVHNFLVSLFVKKRIVKIAWEHNHHNNRKKYIRALVASCKRLDYLVLVSDELTQYYKKYLQNKAIYISHSLDNYPAKASKLDSDNLVAIGRLSLEKGFDDLLKLFKELTLNHPTWKLNLIGDGMQRNNLMDLAEELQLGDKVIFHGYQNKDYINEILLNSSICLMTSHTESFGLVLVEAFSYGVPCIAYDSAQGANEIIEDGVNGYLIKNRNKQAMIEKIDLLIKDEKLRKKLGKKARESAKDYSSPPVLAKWSQIINIKK
ncbi:MAG: glycosyltransferase [Bacilli bacterium]